MFFPLPSNLCVSFSSCLRFVLPLSSQTPTMVVNDTQCFWREKKWKNALSLTSRTMGMEWCLFDVFMGMEWCLFDVFMGMDWCLLDVFMGMKWCFVFVF